MRKYLILMILSFIFGEAFPQDIPVNMVVFGAHPDDDNLDAGGTAIKFAQMGYKIKITHLFLTNSQ